MGEYLHTFNLDNGLTDLFEESKHFCSDSWDETNFEGICTPHASSIVGLNAGIDGL